MRSALVWVFLVAVGIILIVAGSTGRVGTVMAALLTPSDLTDS